MSMTQACPRAPIGHTGAPLPVARLVDEARADANWRAADVQRVLLSFLGEESARDPRLADRLRAHLDDAVSASWRSRTARPTRA